MQAIPPAAVPTASQQQPGSSGQSVDAQSTSDSVSDPNANQSESLLVTGDTKVPRQFEDALSEYYVLPQTELTELSETAEDEQDFDFLPQLIPATTTESESDPVPLLSFTVTQNDAIATTLAEPTGEAVESVTLPNQ
ncbi:MAG: hypothetical protein KDB27_04250, partial [Planctomycetales bacterium]|nr:hypothetical protein [Planctomycetales bacterium]